MSIRLQLLKRFAGRGAMAALALGLLAGIPAARGQNGASAKLKTLYTFTGGSDGGSSNGGLIRDSAGNLYGVTFQGGNMSDCNDSGCGTVYKVSKTGEETVLYSFGNPPDGIHPSQSLLRDKAGNLYGTNYEGGANSYGAVFKVDTSGNETLLYSFQSGTDGEYPGSGVIADAEGNLYGSTGYGGTEGDGTIFEISSSGTETILHNFKGMDGEYPFGKLLRDSSGNIYGTTSAGGKLGNGTVFKLSKSGHLTTLHNFANGTDGETPYAGLVRDAKGNLYGTTSSGGAGCDGFGCGTVFEITAKGKEKVLHAFGSEPDGRYPQFGTLLLDKAGNLYGTTYAGGTDDMGVVFEVTAKGSETVVYSFTGGADEGFPQAGVISDKAGHLYSTTGGNPPTTYGTVFKLTP